jgi:two-component system response regulator HydG
MLGVYKQIALACASDAPVLVMGETGTGKELVARAIHRHGPRAARPFVPVNCGALPEGLLESELFGHVRGAFTGAVADKRGLFEEARGGTLFLDEIGEMAPALQVRLLRTLESGEVRPVGSPRATSVDVRVIAATHRDLERAVKEGAFRRDLFYRLNVVPIDLPPLRHRVEDIPELARHFLSQVAKRERAAFRHLESDAVRLLQHYTWPGNVRELQNIIERAAILEQEPGVIRAATLEPWLKTHGAASVDGLAGRPLADVERQVILSTLERFKGHRIKTASALGIGVRTLGMKLKRWREEGAMVESGN